jgi:hypothetical protein
LITEALTTREAIPTVLSELISSYTTKCDKITNQGERCGYPESGWTSEGEPIDHKDNPCRLECINEFCIPWLTSLIDLPSYAIVETPISRTVTTPISKIIFNLKNFKDQIVEHYTLYDIHEDERKSKDERRKLLEDKIANICRRIKDTSSIHRFSLYISFKYNLPKTYNISGRTSVEFLGTYSDRFPPWPAIWTIDEIDELSDSVISINSDFHLYTDLEYIKFANEKKQIFKKQIKEDEEYKDVVYEDLTRLFTKPTPLAPFTQDTLRESLQKLREKRKRDIITEKRREKGYRRL